MKKVKFTMDFQGSETRNRFYEQGVEYELEDALADLMVKDERAFFVVAEKPEPLIEPVEQVDGPPNDSQIFGAEFESKPRKRTRKHEATDN